MAETAVYCGICDLIAKIFTAVKRLPTDLPKEVAEFTDELESFQDFIQEADKVAEAEKDNYKREKMRKMLMNLRETAFRMEDLIDDYVICDEKQPEEDPRFADLLYETVEIIKTQMLLLQTAYRIQDVKTLVSAKKDGFENCFPIGSRSDDSRGNENFTWHKLRMDPFFMKENEVVGFEGPIQTLTGWLEKGRNERTVISIVGMAGSGKSTLSKQVFDRVHKDFECHAVIIVSRHYTVEGLLRDMLKKLCKERLKDPPRDVETMNRMSLIEEVRNRLCNKRYVILFDDVWNETFWDDIELALIDNENRSRILITTQDNKVVKFCKKAVYFEEHKLQPLSQEKSLELLCKKAFGKDFDGCCPKDYEEVGLDIVRKCGYLPLAIVTIGSLLNRNYESPYDWGLFSQNLSLEMERNSELDSVIKILSLSYEGLPRNLRSCLLYFGMYPKDYNVKCGGLIRRWIAEGFVKHERGRKLEEVAQQQLMELISRNLVLVSSFNKVGKAKRCRVHDLIHEMIREKMKNTIFCHNIDEHNHLESSGVIRRLTIGRNSNCLSGSIEESQYVRSILIFTDEVSSNDFTRRLLAKYTRLKVLDFEYVPLYDVPENLGSLIHLKYLSFRGTLIRGLPKSISNLQNLETLDVRTNQEIKVTEEISKLRKLRYLFGDLISSIEVKDTLGNLTSMEKMHVLSIDSDGVVIGQLGKLKQLRDLRLRLKNTRRDLVDTLCSSINEMSLLERLHILTKADTAAIDLHITSSLSKLRKLSLNCKLKKFTSWIPQCQNLVRLTLVFSNLTDIPLMSLGNMPNLLILAFCHFSYMGEILHFQNEGFPKLKELYLGGLLNLRSIFIDSGALQSLDRLTMINIPQLNVASGFQHLKKLQVLRMCYMSTEFHQKINLNGAKEYLMIKHEPYIYIEPDRISQDEATTNTTATVAAPFAPTRNRLSIPFVWHTFGFCSQPGPRL